MTEIEIQNFLYEIDDELSDDQINSLAEKIFNNQNILLELINMPNHLKIQTESYDKGFQEGANHQNNKPCVCGFWGDK